jgi:hypothetical protein
MAKTSGLALATLGLDDSGGSLRDIRNDVSDLQISTPRAVQDVTGTDKSAIERILLLADLSVTLNGPAFNDAASTGAHTVLKTVPSTSVQRTLTIGIAGTVGTNTLSCEVLITDYGITRGNDGGLSWTAPAVLANGAVPTWA